MCVSVHMCVCACTRTGVRGCAVPRWVQPVRVEDRALVHLHHQHCGRPARLRGGSPKPQDQVSGRVRLGKRQAWHCNTHWEEKTGNSPVAGTHTSPDTCNAKQKQTVKTNYCFLMSVVRFFCSAFLVVLEIATEESSEVLTFSAGSMSRGWHWIMHHWKWEMPNWATVSLCQKQLNWSCLV